MEIYIKPTSLFQLKFPHFRYKILTLLVEQNVLYVVCRRIYIIKFDFGAYEIGNASSDVFINNINDYQWKTFMKNKTL